MAVISPTTWLAKTRTPDTDPDGDPDAELAARLAKLSRLGEQLSSATITTTTPHWGGAAMIPEGGYEAVASTPAVASPSPAKARTAAKRSRPYSELRKGKDG